MDEYRFPKFEKTGKLPVPANANERIDPEALVVLMDIGELVKNTLQSVEKRSSELRDRLRTASEDTDQAGEQLIAEQIGSLRALEDVCQKVLDRQHVLTNEPDADTLKDARALYDELNSIVTHYGQILGT